MAYTGLENIKFLYEGVINSFMRILEATNTSFFILSAFLLCTIISFILLPLMGGNRVGGTKGKSDTAKPKKNKKGENVENG